SSIRSYGLVSSRDAYRDRRGTPPECESDGADGDGDPGSLVHRVLDLRDSVRSTRVVTAAFVVVALIMLLYVTRVGGDFMHGRVLLPSLFLFLLPVAVVPLPVGPAADPGDARVRRVAVPVVAGAWLV